MSCAHGALLDELLLERFGPPPPPDLPDTLPVTAARRRALLDALGMTGDAAGRAVRAHPGDDIDEVVVERLVYGLAVPARSCERREAVQRLAECGVSSREIAQRVRVSVRTVTRYRRGQREAA